MKRSTQPPMNYYIDNPFTSHFYALTSAVKAVLAKSLPPIPQKYEYST